MYIQDVKIIVNGQEMIVTVSCFPNMPQDRLKQLAIGQYIRNLKVDLYRDNNLNEI